MKKSGGAVCLALIVGLLVLGIARTGHARDYCLNIDDIYLPTLRKLRIPTHGQCVPVAGFDANQRTLYSGTVCSTTDNLSIRFDLRSIVIGPVSRSEVSIDASLFRESSTGIGLGTSHVNTIYWGSPTISFTENHGAFGEPCTSSVPFN